MENITVITDEAREARNAYHRAYNREYRKRNDTPENRERRNAYQREWAKKNREKTKEYARRYWEKKIAGVQAQATAEA